MNKKSPKDKKTSTGRELLKKLTELGNLHEGGQERFSRLLDKTTREKK